MSALNESVVEQRALRSTLNKYFWDSEKFAGQHSKDAEFEKAIKMLVVALCRYRLFMTSNCDVESDHWSLEEGIKMARKLMGTEKSK